VQATGKLGSLPLAFVVASYRHLTPNPVSYSAAHYTLAALINAGRLPKIDLKNILIIQWFMGGVCDGKAAM
jgi:hypothetical protein